MLKQNKKKTIKGVVQTPKQDDHNEENKYTY